MGEMSFCYNFRVALHHSFANEKNTKTIMKILSRKVSLLLPVCALVLLAGCKKDKTSTPIGTTSKVYFKAEVSAGSTIKMSTYGYDATLTTASSINSETWTSPEIDVPAGAHVASVSTSAMGAGSTATLKVQVYVNGELKKEGTSTGTALTSTVQYNLK
jgi:hypothetical protein